jgi:hypothetical protein
MLISSALEEPAATTSPAHNVFTKDISRDAGQKSLSGINERAA